MLRPLGLIGSCHRGSYLSTDWELRITRRCLEEDLGSFADTEFEKSLSSNVIVKAFVREHEFKVEAAKTVSPLSSGQTVGRLAHQHDHRGAVWFDEANEVMWLCAYHLHRSGTSGDAFPYFKDLDADDRLLPDEDDYVALADDEGFRFAEAVPGEMQTLLAQARAQPDLELRAIIGGTYEVGLAVESAQPFESVTLAVVTDDWDEEDWDRFGLVLAALRFGEPEALGNVDGIAGRPLDDGETGAEFLHYGE
jgi:hypothetical protein